MQSEDRILLIRYIYLPTEPLFKIFRSLHAIPFLARNITVQYWFVDIGVDGGREAVYLASIEKQR